MTRGRSLTYALKMQCVGHEISKSAEGPADAEIIVAGYSFCYPCGNYALGSIVKERLSIIEVLRRIEDGIYAVAP